MFFALALLVIGIIWLLNALGILQGQVWDIIWPILLIVFALSMLVRNKRCYKDFHGIGKKIRAEFKED